ncbi:MAG TPA: hypothetical protein VFS34_16925 [Thermoanaerobaculia bacterium]|nr:hypothetical protein [Thermoanaerobaculia bacterium]
MIKLRIVVFLLAASLAAPVGARPLAVAHRGTTWIRVWQGFLGFFHGFRLFDATDASGHILPPPTCTTFSSIQ